MNHLNQMTHDRAAVVAQRRADGDALTGGISVLWLIHTLCWAMLLADGRVDALWGGLLVVGSAGASIYMAVMRQAFADSD